MRKFFFLLCLAALFIQIESARKKHQHSIVKLSIRWPSGIEVDKVTDSQGKIYRFGRLQHNSVSLRPSWRSVNKKENVFTETECSDIIQKAEQYASIFGWSKGRHVDYEIRPTKDLPIEVVFQEETEFMELHRKLRERLLPAMASAYALDVAKIRPTDIFITKYNASSTIERQLGLHKDKSPWSFVVALNDAFTGGGTYFQSDASLWQLPIGAAVFFNGNQLHGAQAITQGVRYIMAGFCEYGEELPLESEEAHLLFLATYDPAYDGFAAQSGFMSGDLIVGIEICELSPVASHRRNEDMGSSSEAQVLVDGIDTTTSPTVIRSRRDITMHTTDAEWIAFAQSCEQLEPSSNTVLWVKRRAK